VIEILINLFRRVASAQAIAIVNLMGFDPTGWKRDRFYLTHERARIRLWVANRAYGLRLEQMCFTDPFIYEELSFVDRQLIWMHAKQFYWTDPAPEELVRRIVRTEADIVEELLEAARKRDQTAQR
jgi:hypothetical protein